MSTVTRIKGVVVNDSLPVLTSKGLLSQQVGKYVAKLENMGFYVSDGQLEALNDFMVTLITNDVLQYVKTFYPFIGDSTHKTAVNVPLIGTKELEFASDSSVYDIDANNNIIGITNFINMPNVKMSDVMGEGLFGCGLSYMGTITGDFGVAQRIMTFRNSLDDYVFRIMNKRSDGMIFSLFHYYDNTQVEFQDFTYDIGSNYNDLIGVHCYTELGGYVRIINEDGIIKNSTGATSGNPKDFYDGDATIKETSKLGGIDCITSLMFMDGRMPKNTANIWTNALYTLLTSLGKVTV